MKTTITTLAILISAGLSFGQEDDSYQDYRSNSQDIKTLFSKGAKIRGYGALDVKYSEVHKDNSMLVGAHGGIIVNQHFILGLGAYGLSSVNRFDGIDPNEELYLYGGYGGLIIGYTIAPKEVIHISFPILIAGGGFQVSDKNYFNEIGQNDEIRLDHQIERSTALVIEPGVEVEINITKFCRLGLGGSYRMVNGVSLAKNDITDSDLSNWSTHASLKFGKFW
jgi:hypothetical protein